MEKVSFSDTQNLGLFVNTLTIDEKHYLLSNREFNESNSDKIISKTKKILSSFFVFLKSKLNFKHLPTKDNPHS